MIPDYQSVMFPLLKILEDGKEHTLREIIDNISDQFDLSEKEKSELLPSGNQAIINNRVGWARTYLKKAGLLSSPKRATFVITDEGSKLLKSGIDSISTKYLKSLNQFQEWISEFPSNTNQDELGSEVEETIESDRTPQERLELAYNRLFNELSAELLDTVKSATPQFFEVLVIDLLVNMGYGGSKREAGLAIGKSGDGGIDGVIKEDKLGLDLIYVQAKKYEGTIPIAHVRDFAGALLGQKARKGIFITTSNYPKSAFEFVQSIEPKIILIDGQRLTKLMIEYNVGVSIDVTYHIKKLDSDYFEET